MQGAAGLFPGWTCEVHRKESAIRALDGVITDLRERSGQGCDTTLRVAYFLANLTLRSAIPAMTLVRNAGRLTAVLFGGEARFYGIPSGIVVCGDHCGDGFLVAAETDRATALQVAVLHLLSRKRVHSVLLRSDSPVPDPFPCGGLNLRTSVQTPDVRRDLAVTTDYQTFLASLGHLTRRNLRYYRRRADRSGWTFHDDLSESTAAEAMQRLEGRQKFAKSSRQLRACLDFVGAAPEGLRFGLRTAAGEWVAIAGARIETGADRMSLFFQLNHLAYRYDSVSLVMRSWLIEHAIARGLRSIAFLNGCQGTLRPYCDAGHCRHLLIEKESPAIDFAKSVAARFFPRLAGLSRLHQFYEAEEG